MASLPTTPAPSILHLAFPAPAEVSAAVLQGARAPLSYPMVGATAGPMPEGWDHDDAERVVGTGAADWHHAREAVRAWKPFALSWVRLHRADTPLRVGEPVAFSSWQFGLWTLNVCRIVAVIDEEGPEGGRFGFTYGTVAGHVVAGEERFLARWDRETDAVTFGIRKFSRPNHPLVRLVGPFARRLQRRFTTEAIDAVARAIAEAR